LEFTAPHLTLSAILNLTISKGYLGSKKLTYIERSNITPVFRSCTVNNKLIVRIEKLADHINGQSKVHAPEYIAAIKKYADLVLGESSSQAEEATNLNQVKNKKLAA